MNTVQKDINFPYQQTSHKLIIAEKPSVVQSSAAVLGATERKDGYVIGNGLCRTEGR